MPSKSSRKLPRKTSTATLRAHAGRTPDIKEAVAVGADTPGVVKTMDSLCQAMGLELVDVTPTVRKYRKVRPAKVKSAQGDRKCPVAPKGGPLTNDDTADDEEATDEEKWAEAGT